MDECPVCFLFFIFFPLCLSSLLWMVLNGCWLPHNHFTFSQLGRGIQQYNSLRLSFYSSLFPCFPILLSKPLFFVLFLSLLFPLLLFLVMVAVFLLSLSVFFTMQLVAIFVVSPREGCCYLYRRKNVGCRVRKVTLLREQANDEWSWFPLQGILDACPSN